MTQRVGVLLVGGPTALAERLVGAVATGDGLGEVRAVEHAASPADVAGACARLAEVVEVVVGLGAAPWPGWTAWHDAAHEELGELPYWAVETWHALPSFHDALVAAVGERWASGPRVVLTAPDAAVRELPPEQRVVLRDVAEALHARTGVRPVVAVDRSPGEGAVTPTAVTTVTTLAEAHGATRALRLSLAPGDGPDDAVAAAAVAAGLALDDVALDLPTVAGVLRDAVGTLLAQAIAGGAA